MLVDEAYFEFVDRPDAGRTMSLARERPNLLVTRTFSKAHGLCGLRVGYGVGGAGWVDALDRVRQPFNTNALAQAAALESLRHPAALDRRVRETLSERARVTDALADTRWAFTPSQGNFVLVAPDAIRPPGLPGVHEQLLRLGVIVRDGASLGCPGRLRVSIGTPEENDGVPVGAGRGRRARRPARPNRGGRRHDDRPLSQAIRKWGRSSRLRQVRYAHGSSAGRGKLLRREGIVPRRRTTPADGLRAPSPRDDGTRRESPANLRHFGRAES